MPEAQEVMSDDERESYRRTQDLGITSVMSTVRVPVGRKGGHNVVLATRGDGATVWVDRTCQRATTPGFNAARQPFVDEAVIAWHAGKPIDVYDYVTRLVNARDALTKARAAVRMSRTAANRAARDAAEATRTEIIYLAMDRTDLSQTTIARHAGVSLATLYRIRRERS